MCSCSKCRRPRKCCSLCHHRSHDFFPHCSCRRFSFHDSCSCKRRRCSCHDSHHNRCCCRDSHRDHHC